MKAQKTIGAHQDVSARLTLSRCGLHLLTAEMGQIRPLHILPLSGSSAPKAVVLHDLDLQLTTYFQTRSKYALPINLKDLRRTMPL